MLLKILLWPVRLVLGVIIGIFEKVMAYILFSAIVIGVILHLAGVDVIALLDTIIQSAVLEGEASTAVNSTTQEVEETRRTVTGRFFSFLVEAFKEALRDML